jgi:hypothetical protein
MISDASKPCFPAPQDDNEPSRFRLRHPVEFSEELFRSYLDACVIAEQNYYHVKTLRAAIDWYITSFWPRVSRLWLFSDPIDSEITGYKKLSETHRWGQGAIAGAWLPPIFSDIIRSVECWMRPSLSGELPRPAWAPADPDVLSEYIWAWIAGFIIYGRSSELQALHFRDLILRPGSVWRIALHGVNAEDGFRSKTERHGETQYAYLPRAVVGIPLCETLIKCGMCKDMSEKECIEQPMTTARLLFWMVYQAVTVFHKQVKWKVALIQCNSVAQFLQQHGHHFCNLPVFPNFKPEVSNRITKFLAEHHRFPTHNMESPPRPLRWTLHGLRSAAATVAICIAGQPVELVMAYGHWESATVADYVQHLHPTLAILRTRLGEYKVDFESMQLLQLRGGSWKAYQPQLDAQIEPEASILKVTAVVAVRRRLASARAQRHQAAIDEHQAGGGAPSPSVLYGKPLCSGLQPSPGNR